MFSFDYRGIIFKELFKIYTVYIAIKYTNRSIPNAESSFGTGDYCKELFDYGDRVYHKKALFSTENTLLARQKESP